MMAKWRTFNRRFTTVTIKRQDGSLVGSPQESADALREHWGPIFAPHSPNPDLVNILSKYIVKADRSIDWHISDDTFAGLPTTCRRSAPGPDGIPYRAWACSSACLHLTAAFRSWCNGSSLPSDFNESFLVFLPKPDKNAVQEPVTATSMISPSLVIRAPDDTRPLNLSNTDAKLFAKALNIPLSEAASLGCSSHQRGFINGRLPAEGPVLLSAYWLVHVILGSPKAGHLLLDLKAAFASISHEWMFHCLSSMGIPADFIRLVRDLHTGCSTSVAFAGALSAVFLMLRGIKQGCPAGPSIFALCFDPVVRYLADIIGGLPHNLLCALADDLALTLQDLFKDVPRIVDAFAVVTPATGP